MKKNNSWACGDDGRIARGDEENTACGDEECLARGDEKLALRDVGVLWNDEESIARGDDGRIVRSDEETLARGDREHLDPALDVWKDDPVFDPAFEPIAPVAYREKPPTASAQSDWWNDPPFGGESHGQTGGQSGGKIGGQGHSQSNDQSHGQDACRSGGQIGGQSNCQIGGKIGGQGHGVGDGRSELAGYESDDGTDDGMGDRTGDGRRVVQSDAWETLLARSTEYAGCAAFTGHRYLPEGSREELVRRLSEVIEKLYARGVRRFYAGGAIGFDMLASFAVVRARRVHPDVVLVLALPCRDHTLRWSYAAKAEFERLRSLADEVVMVSDEDYRSGCMLKRDRYMVDRAAYCVAYLTKQSGGTFYTVGYAEKKGKRVINLASGAYETEIF